MRLGVLSQPHHPALREIMDRLRSSADDVGAELVLTADLLAVDGRLDQVGGGATIGSGFVDVTVEGSLDPGSRTADGTDTSLVGELTILGSLDLTAADTHQ